jgi:hypothetical protein
MYDFHKCREPAKLDSLNPHVQKFKHSYFIRGKPYLLSNILRKTPEYQLLDDRYGNEASGFFQDKLN